MQEVAGEEVKDDKGQQRDEHEVGRLQGHDVGRRLHRDGVARRRRGRRVFYVFLCVWGQTLALVLQTLSRGITRNRAHTAGGMTQRVSGQACIVFLIRYEGRGGRCGWVGGRPQVADGGG